MPSTRGATRLAGALLLATTALAACSGDDDDGDSNSPAESTSTAAPQPQATDTTGISSGETTSSTRAPTDVLPATTEASTTTLGVDSTVSSLGVATTQAD
jgi:hypothetical protein